MRSLFPSLLVAFLVAGPAVAPASPAAVRPAALALRPLASEPRPAEPAKQTSRLSKFNLRALPGGIRAFSSGLSGTLKATFARKFGGFDRAYETAQKLSDERLAKMPQAVQADLAGVLLKPGLLHGREVREGASSQFVRVLTAHGRDPGHVLGTLSRLGIHDPAAVENKLSGPARAEYAKLIAASHPTRGDWNGFQTFADAATQTRERTGSKVEPLINGNRYYPALNQALDGAKRYVLMEKYVIHADDSGRELNEHLGLANQRGVFTEAIYDQVGSANVDPHQFAEMKAAGTKALPFAPRRFLGGSIDHRKQVIVDGKEGFIGGMNIGVDYRDIWHDVQSRVTGPALADMEALVAKQTKNVGGKLPRGVLRSIRQAGRAADLARPETPDEPTTRVVAHEGFRDQHEKLLYLRAIDTSAKRVLIENPYMADQEVVKHLGLAARRGVDVSVVLPARSDSRLLQAAQHANYPELLAAGVKIYEYLGKDPKNPVMSHGKVGVFDDHVATIGSTNLDARSLINNDEVNVWVKDPELNKRLTSELFETDFKMSRQVTEDHPNAFKKLENRALKVLSKTL